MSCKFKVSSLLLLFTFLFTAGSCSDKTEIPSYVKNVEQAQALLKKERSEALQALEQKVTPEKIARLVELGLWDKAKSYLTKADTTKKAIKLVRAQLLIKRHHYSKAETKVEAVLNDNPRNSKAQLLRARLYIQSWQLNKADQVAQELMKNDNWKVEAGHIRGTVAMFNRNYDQALQWAGKIQDWDPQNAAGFLLEAETLFWSKNASAAEPALVQALKRNPFSTDARFSYGYAIWRRVDATLLDEMAAQWNFALEINPLHYLTHWHFGNGHTNRTYAYYAEPSDSAVQAELEQADLLVAQGNLDEAIALTRKIGRQYPGSVIPDMVRGSIFYMYYGMDREARLDSAASIFRHILKQKQNYGPAHNGLAAVIKQRQFSYLDGYEKLEQAIKNTQLPESEAFYEVFPDLSYYPGGRIAKMVAQQIGPSRAYLPMINTLGRDFQLPPLHHNLAEAMGSAYFLYGTTFDNRQWMDIRGVGSGATGIEYIERGSHWERNVLAHEYAHLYHGSILTYKESRRIRALYHAAMVNNRTLDYYSANNESEFFAQAYEAYLSAKKVHPLTHKSMNTREYLRKKDPTLYAFIDSLIQKQKAYLRGNKEVMKSNWAQTYVTLADNNSPEMAKTYLDTALSYDSRYIPALLKYARVEAKQGNFSKSANWITKALEVDKNYAPIYITKAYSLHQKALQGKTTFKSAFKKQKPLFEKALKIEHDLAVLARINRIYRRRSLQYGQVAKAIKITEQYLENPPAISTYLVDRKERAQVFLKSLYGNLGYAPKYISFFNELLQQNPQNFYYRLKYADILIKAQKWQNALEVLQEGQRILAAADDRRPGYVLRIADVLLNKGNVETARQELASIENNSLSFEQKLYLARLHVQMGEVENAIAVKPDKDQARAPYKKAQWAYIKGLLKQKKNKTDVAIQAYRSALQWNPYHLQARIALIQLLKASGEADRVRRVKNKAKQLPISINL